MTLTKAKAILKQLGMAINETAAGDYRVNFINGNEVTAYCTDDLQDAVNTARAMWLMQN